MLHIYNTLSKQKHLFTPLHPPKIGLYVCGVTVYDYCHIGHARTYLSFDMIQRYLLYKGFDVTYVRNITDVDDKIINRSLEQKKPWKELTEFYIQAMHEDFHQSLKMLPPQLEPKATDFVPKMIELIQILIDKNMAYLAPNKDVYFDVHKFNTYGALSHRHLEDLLVGARIEPNEAKQNPLDFVLWKAAKPGEPAWDSPFGLGRPGWHIECSAMAMEYLGQTLDIHGGGPDLKFPHHENERAQSEGVTGQEFVRIWMHTGYLQIDKEKMSKSTGNFITIRDFLKEYPGEVLRYFTLASHYRSPVEYATVNLDFAYSALFRLYTALRGLDLDTVQEKDLPVDTDFEKKFVVAMDDDFNTPIALAVLFDLVREINRLRAGDKKQATQYAALLRKLANILGLLLDSPEVFLQGNLGFEGEEAEKIEALIAKRTEARQSKNWAESDRIRDELKARGIILEDGASGTLWRKEKVSEKT